MLPTDALKGVLSAGLFCITYTASVVPILIRVAARRRHYSLGGPEAARAADSGQDNYKFMMLFSFMSCYGGGVFLSTCLLDLFPDCQETLRDGE